MQRHSLVGEDKYDAKHRLVLIALMPRWSIDPNNGIARLYCKIECNYACIYVCID